MASLTRPKFNLRLSTSFLIREHRWMPALATLSAGFFLTIALTTHLHLLLILLAAVLLPCASYVWGYSAHALKGIRWRKLTHLQRQQYAEVWDSLASSPELAMAAACGELEEGGVRHSAAKPLNQLLRLAKVNLQDDVLEIGCGVGRIGLELAPHCRHWTGADISANMLACAADRLRALNNVRFVQLQEISLRGMAAGSFDVVYSTNMFAHIDQMDRWRYVEEAFRVLRPGGRLCIDNLDMESERAWASFAIGAKISQQHERPPYLPTLSTAPELMAYATQAGFQQVRPHREPPLVIVIAVKPYLAAKSLLKH
jgi:ubiquinone/menaquinone biosynthesis C-methylase UbiE